MKNKLVMIVIVAVLVVFFFPKSYISSPGLTTMENAQQFEMNREHCFGFSRLTNAMEAAADAPGKSLCFGWLY